MFSNYFKTAIRSLWKSKGFTLLNILGLSIGIGAALLLALFVRYELSYDQFYEDGDRIYRVSLDTKFNGRERTSITSSGLLGPTLEQEFPEIAITGRSHRVGNQLLSYEDKRFYESRLRFADPGLLEILEMKFLDGSSATLTEPNSIVLTETLAAKLFNQETNIIGESIKVGDDLVSVTGIIKDLPKNSHYSATGFLSTATLGNFTWNRVGHMTYVKLQSPEQREAVIDKFPNLVQNYMAATMPDDFEAVIDLYPVSDIYLSEDPGQEGAGNYGVVISFSIIALFILLIASINYMNLATARAMNRHKEIGMRKVVGAAKKQLIFQFLVESWVVALTSVIIGGFVAEMSTGLFNQLTGKAIELSFLSNGAILGTLVLLGLLVGFLAGIYPAFYLSSFRPSEIFKNSQTGGRGGKNLRRILVSVQFIISIGLIISTLAVYKQLSFLDNKDLGYNEEQLLSIRLRKADKSEIFKQQLLQIPGVKAVTATNLLPATGDAGATFEITNAAGETSADIVSMASIDHDYIKAMEMELIQGRNFLPNLTDAKSIIVNEKLAQKYGWENPIGQTLSINNSREQDVFKIIGVVKDFNMLSLYQEVKPFAFFLKPQFDWGGQYLLTRIDPLNASETLEAIESAYGAFEPDYPINSFFVDDYFQRVYEEETKRGEIYLSFSILTIVIACVGLFGLAAFILQQKVKEISIRKVLGANVSHIISLVSREFVLIIILATVIASPLAYYFIQSWLASFEYQVNVGLESFIIAGVASMTIALATISFQSIRTARTNPAEILKNE